MTKKKKGTGAGTLLILLGILILLSSLMAALCFYYKDHSVITKDINLVLPNGGETVDGYRIEMTYGEKSWANADKSSLMLYGTEYDATLYNESGNSMEDWTVSFNVPKGSIIDSSWNGEYLIVDDTITVTAVDYNRSLDAEKGMTQPFGFVLYTKEAITIDSFTLTAIETEIHKIYEHVPFWIMAVAVFTMLVILITNLFTFAHYKRLSEKYEVMQEVTDQALRTFARTIDAKDDYTFGHSYRVAVYARQIAEKLGLPVDEQENIYYIGLLHDIGKIGIPDKILTKAGKLDDNEWERIKTHVLVGGDILAEFSSIPGVQDGARYHHERYDGKGYAKGLSGKNIPLYARIICVADSYDAMSSARCYRAALDKETILSELEKGSGTQFDPDIAAVMIKIIEEKGIQRPEE